MAWTTVVAVDLAAVAADALEAAAAKGPAPRRSGSDSRVSRCGGTFVSRPSTSGDSRPAAAAGFGFVGLRRSASDR